MLLKRRLIICGIAGYSTTQKWCDQLIDEDKQYKILEQAWLHNQHRGFDAAGYMGITNDDEIVCFKLPEDAVSILTDLEENKETSIEPMRTFGTHVRAQTQGDYKDNWNNHPVYFNDVWVVHNGGISNDDEIRKTVKINQDAIPVVDSVAINIVLSQIKDPHNLDE